jgi:hypothetical protein
LDFPRCEHLCCLIPNCAIQSDHAFFTFGEIDPDQIFGGLGLAGFV